MGFITMSSGGLLGYRETDLECMDDRKNALQVLGTRRGEEQQVAAYVGAAAHARRSGTNTDARAVTATLHHRCAIDRLEYAGQCQCRPGSSCTNAAPWCYITSSSNCGDTKEGLLGSGSWSEAACAAGTVIAVIVA